MSMQKWISKALSKHEKGSIGVGILAGIMVALGAVLIFMIAIPMAMEGERQNTLNQALLTLAENDYVAYGAPTGDWTTLGDLYTQDIYPQGDSTYNVGTNTNRYLNGYYDNLYASNSTITALDAPTGRGATYVIAASDATALEKNQADVVLAADDDIGTVVNAAFAAGNLYVHLTTGTFLSTTRINMISNSVLEGSGWATILKFKNGTTPSYSMVESASPAGTKFVVKNLQIDGNKANTTDPVDHIKGCGFHASAASYYIIENLYVHDTWYRGISQYGSQWATIRNNYIVDANAEAINLDYGSEAMPTAYNQVVNNHIYGRGGGNGGEICIDGTYGPNHDNTISGNTIIGAYIGIRTVNYNVTNCIITNNIVEETTYGILDNGTGNKINNNTILQTSSYSIQVNKDSQVQGNTIILPRGVLWIKGNNAIVQGNHILGGNKGMQIDGNYGIISDNHILNSYDVIPLTVNGDSNNLKGNHVELISASTTLAVAAVSGDTVIQVADGTAFVSGTRVRIQKDDLAYFATYAKRVRGNYIELLEAIDGNAAIGKAVATYLPSTKKITVSVGADNNRFYSNDFLVNIDDFGSNNDWTNNTIFAAGEFRTYSGSLSAGTVGNAVIAYQNPKAQAMMATGRTLITTGATAAATGDWGLATTIQVVENCEDVWNVTAPAAGHSTCAVDTTYVERGTNDIAITATAGVANADILAWEQTAATLDLSTATHISLKFRSNVALNAGDMSIALDQAADFGTPIAWVTLPAIAANTTTLVVLNPNGGAALGAGYNSIDSIGIRVNNVTRYVSGKIIYLDDIRAITVGTDLVNDANLQTLGIANYATPVQWDYKNNDDATHHDTLVMVSAANASTGLVGSWYITGQGE